jgi:hypothetical protein
VPTPVNMFSSRIMFFAKKVTDSTVEKVAKVVVPKVPKVPKEPKVKVPKEPKVPKVPKVKKEPSATAKPPALFTGKYHPFTVVIPPIPPTNPTQSSASP